MWVTEDEHRRLLERCDGKQLAAWMRQTCLDEKPARAGKLPSISPALLRQLAGMGNNLNQIARQVNAGGGSGIDRVQVIASLMAIDAGLERLRHAVLEKGLTMIVKFHPRGRGSGAGPVDYLLGKDRQRDGATVLQGKPEEVRELIDASPYPKNTPPACCLFPNRTYRPASVKS